jgi:integrase
MSISTSTAELVEKYKSFKAAEGVSKGTLREYNSKLDKFANYFPTLPLDPDQIAEYLGQLKCDPITKWDIRKHIMAFYHFLERRNIIAVITPTFPKVKFPRKVRRVLTEDEVVNLFNYAETLQDKAILTLLIDSKLRAGELCSLTREHVLQDSVIVTGKNGQRSIPISPLTYSLLTKLTDSGPLFSIDSRPMNRKLLYNHLHELMKRSGLTGKKLGPHILRHSASVFHIMHGGGLLELQKELGHITLKMTEKYGELAAPQVKQKHQETNVIGHIIDKIAEVKVSDGAE